MKPLSVKTREIYINNDQKNSLCDTFVYEPSNIEEENLGNLYITGELHLEDALKDETQSFLVNLLASVIKREYYSSSKREPLKSLEIALKKANITLNGLAEKGNTNWMGNLHFITGCLMGNTLHIAQSGNVKSILIRGGGLTDIGEIIPALGNQTPFKTFSSIASGKLKEGDLIIFSTPGLLEVITTQELKLLDPQSSIEEISRKIQEMLSQKLNDKKISLGAIILKIGSQEGISYAQHHRESFQQSEIKQAQAPEEKEEGKGKKEEYLLKGAKLLKVILFWGLQKLLIFLAIGGLKALKAFSSLIKSLIKSIPIKLHNILKPTLRAVTQRVKKATLVPLRAKPQREASSGRAKITKGPPYFKDIVNHPLRRQKPFIRFLPSSSKILLTISILLVILLGASLGIIYRKRAFELKINQYRELLEEAYQKEDKAQAAIIYQDQEKARVFLKDARELTASVLNGTDYLKKESLRLLSRIENQGDALDKVVNLIEPKLIFDFSNLNFSPQQIIGLGKKLYLIDSQNSFYRLDLKDLKNPSKVNVSFSNIGHLKMGTSLEDSIVFYTNTPGIAIFEKDGIESVDISRWQTPLGQAIKDIASYHKNIYLLSLKQNQILKSYKTRGGFNNPRFWLKEEVNLEETCSLAIDGAIYILKENGEILKYLQGKRVEFKNPEIFNPLKKTTKIFTTPTFRNLYIIDREAKKVVVIDKQGNLVKQYFSEKFDNIKDIYVSDDEENIFLLSGSKIYQVSTSTGQ